MANIIVNFFRDRGVTIVSGLAALMLIVAGFLLFNFYSGLQKTQSPIVREEVKENQVVETNGPSSLGTQVQNLPTTYLVVRGDNLSTIAQKFYGDSGKWTEIAKANRLANPQVIHASNVFVIPQLTTPPVAQTTPSTSVLGTTTITPQPGSTYTVQDGDTLWDLAIAAYGSGYEWYRIDQANGVVPRNISSYPLIFPGQQLKIP